MEQHAIDFEAARLARDAGIAAAADHAERETPGWKDLAYDVFVDYARHNAEFLTEDVRFANPQLPQPPDKRAWGHVAIRAVKAGVIEHGGFAKAKDAKVHCSVNTLWRSRVCVRAAA